MRNLLAVMVAIVVLPAGVCWSGTIYVKPDGTGDAPTIGAALAAAAVGDTVLLASGTFTGAGNHGLTVPNRNLTIVSETGDPGDCVVECEAATYGFRFENCGAAFSGLTITNAGDGGFVLERNYGHIALAVSNCVFSNCVGGAWGQFGGAVCDDAAYAEVSLVGCTFLANSTELGGAIFYHGGPYSLVTIDRCTFCSNTAVSGGAICCGTMEEMVVIRNSVFCHNVAAGRGGAVYTMESAPEITGCTFFANSAPAGSAIASMYSMETVMRCVIAYGAGGSVYDTDSPEWCCDNITCTNIYGNEGGDWVGALADQLGQDGNFSACPSFCNGWAEPYDLHLCSSSPCLPGNHPDGVSCGLIGALGQGCDCGPSAVEPTTWGAIKAMYR